MDGFIRDLFLQGSPGTPPWQFWTDLGSLLTPFLIDSDCKLFYTASIWERSRVENRFTILPHPMAAEARSIKYMRLYTVSKCFCHADLVFIHMLNAIVVTSSNMDPRFLLRRATRLPKV